MSSTEEYEQRRCFENGSKQSLMKELADVFSKIPNEIPGVYAITGNTYSVLPPVFHNGKLRREDPNEFIKQMEDGINKIDEEHKGKPGYKSFSLKKCRMFTSFEEFKASQLKGKKR